MAKDMWGNTPIEVIAKLERHGKITHPAQLPDDLKKLEEWLGASDARALRDELDQGWSWS